MTTIAFILVIIGIIGFAVAYVADFITENFSKKFEKKA